jgi:N-acetylglutamate synthase-like GNAT family acetyltransferase
VSGIRAAGSDDAAAIAGLVNRAYRVEEFFVEGDRTDAAEVRRLLADGAFLLLEEEGALAGCVYLKIADGRGYLGLLAVDPARQGGGRGRSLVGAVEEACRAAGARHLDLTVVNLRLELPPFYERLGFRRAGTAPFPDDARVKQACHFVRYTKPLDPE